MKEVHIKGEFVSFITLLALSNLGHTWMNRTKLCVEFRVQNSRWNYGILDVSEKTSESGCLRQCARNPNCSAFNLWRNGTCELVRGMGNCKETEEQKRSTYVHLGECTGGVPWDVGRRNWSADVPCLTWQQHHAGAVCPSGALRGRFQTLSCVAVIPHKGLYLVGRYVASRYFQSASENAQPMWNCNDHGYIPHVAAGCPTTWQHYSVGDDLPSGAVRLSSWKDGSPVYLVSTKVAVATWKVGCYLASKQKAFALFDGQMITPKSMSILVYIWRLVFQIDMHIVRKATICRINVTPLHPSDGMHSQCGLWCTYKWMDHKPSVFDGHGPWLGLLKA